MYGKLHGEATLVIRTDLSKTHDGSTDMLYDIWDSNPFSTHTLNPFMLKTIVTFLAGLATAKQFSLLTRKSLHISFVQT